MDANNLWITLFSSWLSLLNCANWCRGPECISQRTPPRHADNFEKKLFFYLPLYLPKSIQTEQPASGRGPRHTGAAYLNEVPQTRGTHASLSVRCSSVSQCSWGTLQRFVHQVCCSSSTWELPTFPLTSLPCLSRVAREPQWPNVSLGLILLWNPHMHLRHLVISSCYSVSR